jgi:hypothetical protein
MGALFLLAECSDARITAEEFGHAAKIVLEMPVSFLSVFIFSNT